MSAGRGGRTEKAGGFLSSPFQNTLTYEGLTLRRALQDLGLGLLAGGVSMWMLGSLPSAATSTSVHYAGVFLSTVAVYVGGHAAHHLRGARKRSQAAEKVAARAERMAAATLPEGAVTRQVWQGMKKTWMVWRDGNLDAQPEFMDGETYASFKDELAESGKWLVQVHQYAYDPKDPIVEIRTFFAGRLQDGPGGQPAIRRIRRDFEEENYYFAGKETPFWRGLFSSMVAPLVDYMRPVNTHEDDEAIASEIAGHSFAGSLPLRPCGEATRQFREQLRLAAAEGPVILEAEDGVTLVWRDIDSVPEVRRGTPDDQVLFRLDFGHVSGRYGLVGLRLERMVGGKMHGPEGGVPAAVEFRANGLWREWSDVAAEAGGSSPLPPRTG